MESVTQTRERVRPHLQPTATEGSLRRQLDSNFTSSESQKVRGLCQRSSNQWDLLAALGLLTQLEGNIQSGHKNPDIPEYAGEAGLCKCQTLSSITPTTIPQTSQAGHLPDLTDCYNHQTSAGWCPSGLNSRTQALRMARAGTQTRCPRSWRVRCACASPPEHTLLLWDPQNRGLNNSLCWQVRQANLRSSIATDMKLKQ